MQDNGDIPGDKPGRIQEESWKIAVESREGSEKIAGESREGTGKQTGKMPGEKFGGYREDARRETR